VGRTHGHQWGEKMAAGGENRWPYLGRNRWPLTRDLDTAIEQTPDEERRSKLLTLRDGLVGAGRDIALAYFEKKVIGI
jgi:hypothetical protein